MAWYDVTGTVSDWVMASAAVYAAINAKRWFSQRSHTKGFDKAEEIISIIDSLHRERNDYTNQLYITNEYLGAIDDRSTHPDDERYSMYSGLSKKHSDKIKSIDILYEELVLIERWSIEIINIDLIKSVIKSLRQLNASASNAYNASYSCIYNINSMGRAEFEDSFKRFKSYYDDFLRDLAILEANYDKFKKNKFTKFFRVN